MITYVAAVSCVLSLAIGQVLFKASATEPSDTDLRSSHVLREGIMPSLTLRNASMT
jgi:hypothetical protein